MPFDTYEIVDHQPHPINPRMRVIRLRLRRYNSQQDKADGKAPLREYVTSGNVLQGDAIFGDKFDPVEIAGLIKQSLDERDSTAANIETLRAGGEQEIPALPQAPAGLSQFRQRWFQLRNLKALQPFSATNLTAFNNRLAALQGQVEDALLANPGWIDEVR